ncbi:MAG: B12-binding domain-containing radical SAM protein [Spirochaetes bacterium]|nr:B12-binding domain-containing radical SAM protein [Spirochaetota bacterium]
MKILFITTNFIIEPLGIMYLSGSLKKQGHKVSILKILHKEYEKKALTKMKKPPEEVIYTEKYLIKKIKEIKPDIIAYSVTTGMHQFYLNLNRDIKRQIFCYSVFGGPHPTFFPRMIHEDGVDAICIGEGEEAFVEFAGVLQKGGSLKKIKNFWVKEDGRIFRNEVRPLIQNLDKIPFPDREIIYQFSTSLKNPIKNFFCIRGCPYNCTYCFNHAYYEIYRKKGQRIRIRSVENVLKEIKEVKKRYPLEVVYFQDDTFILSRSWLENLLKRYKKEIDLPYHCHIRANLVTEDIIELLKDTGCLSVTLALETADDYLRNKMLKRNMSLDQIHQACRLLRKYRIRFRAENMVGLPGGNLKTALETLRMNIKCKPDIGWASLYQPYMGTELGEFCFQKKMAPRDLDNIMPSFFETSILNLKHKKQIENLQKLFSITVELPFLLPLVRLLIHLPPNRVFNWIYKTWKRYCYNHRLYKPK